jgi:hypothetical protein
MTLQTGANWFNADGLFIPFGRNEATTQNVGEFCNSSTGDCREVQVVLDLAALAIGETILSESVRFPKEAIFQEIEVYTEIAATSGGAPTLAVGTIDLERVNHTAPSGVANGLITAQALAIFQDLGSKKVFGDGSSSPAGATAGTLIINATELTAPVLLSVTVATAVFTAGRVRFRIRYVPTQTSGQSGN